MGTGDWHRLLVLESWPCGMAEPCARSPGPNLGRTVVARWPVAGLLLAGAFRRQNVRTLAMARCRGCCRMQNLGGLRMVRRCEAADAAAVMNRRDAGSAIAPGQVTLGDSARGGATPGHAPVAPHGGDRHVQGVRGFLQAQAAEEPHLDHAALPRVNRLEAGERLVQRDDLGSLDDREVASVQRSGPDRARASLRARGLAPCRRGRGA